MSIDDITRGDAIEAAIAEHERRRFRELLCCVVEYDDTKQSAKVRPLSKVDGVTMPDIPNRPVFWPAGTITKPLAAGDLVTLHVLDFSIDEILDGQSSGDPFTTTRTSSAWRGSLSNSYVVPGFKAFSSPLPSEAVDPVAAVVYHPTEVKLGDSTASQLVALADLVLAELNKIKTKFDTHTHAYIPGTLPSAPTSTPTPTLDTPSSVAATKVKAK